MPRLALLLLLTLLALQLREAAFAPVLSRQTSCPNKCKKESLKSSIKAACKKLKASCRVKQCTRRGKPGFVCQDRKGPTTTPIVSTPSPSITPATFEPRFADAVLCKSGPSIYNVGVVTKANELFIPMFAKTEEKAMEWIDCIKEDRSSRSVEEYLRFTDENCLAEDPKPCSVDFATNPLVCTCKKGQPDRCIKVPYSRSVRRCNDEP